MATQFSTTVTFNASPDAVLAAAADVFQRDFQVRPAQGPRGVTGKTGMSMMGWGENLIVSVDSAMPQSTSVTVRSSPVWPLQLIDFGKHRRNVEKLLGGLSRRLEPGPAGAYGPPRGPAQ